ncbi:unnamed protein product [Prorocentrum cordatum]|uniref:Uncharacterized protein n=1 Tax=Prorocentrum cordatum TaxID=2364126 RepID=A0ABN9SR35_9DINO|nr:unnamed protein product [Polarella glacialis]
MVAALNLVTDTNALSDQPPALSDGACGYAAEVPLPPVAIYFSYPGTGEVYARWPPSPSDGGAAIEFYELTMNNGWAATNAPDDRDHIVQDCDQGDVVSFQVRARNAVGWGEYSSAFSAVCAAAPPMMDPVQRTISTRTSIKVEWSPPSVDGGAPVSSYRLYRATGNGALYQVYAGTDTEFDSVGLATGTTYRFVVTSVNVAGEGPQHEPVQMLCSGTPGAPVDFQISQVSSFEAVASWTPPADDGGTEIIRYEIWYTDDMSAGAAIDRLAWSGSGTVSDVLVFSSGTSLKVQVASVNVINDQNYIPGTRADAITHYMAVPSQPPVVYLAASTLLSVTLAWSEPADTGGLPPTSYTVHVDDGLGGPFTQVYNDNLLTYTHVGMATRAALQFVEQFVLMSPPARLAARAGMALRGGGMGGTARRRQLGALLRKGLLSRRRRWVSSLAELLLPVVLALPLAGVRVLGGDEVVPVKTSVERAVELGDPFATRYAARLCRGGAIFAVAPEGRLGREFRAFLRGRFALLGVWPFGWPRLVPFPSREEVDGYVALDDYGSKARPALCGAISFDDELGGQYTLRLNGTIGGNRNAPCGGVDTRRTTTGRAIDAKLTSKDWYACSGFLALQKLADEFLLERQGISTEGPWRLDLTAVPFPTPSYKSRNALSAAREVIALASVLFFAYAAGQAAGRVVAEREMKLLEAMKLMGLEDHVRFIAHVAEVMPMFAIYGAEFGVSLSLCVFTRSSLVLLVTFFSAAGLAMATMALAASALFGIAKTASLSVVVGSFLLSRFPVQSAWACLLPPVALTQGLNRIVEFELQDIGLQRSNIWDELGFSCSMGFLLALQIVSVPSYLAIWIYLERVVPRQYGTAPCPWYRPWELAAAIPSGRAGALAGAVKRQRVSSGAASVVEDSMTVDCMVEVSDVRKEFVVEGRRRSHTIVAVRSLDLGMAEGEILALLGHNGAGKSTTVGMLTGVLRPTRGRVTVYGCDVALQPAEARRHLGVCPQYDILFEDLTAAEHLELAWALKGAGKGSAVTCEGLLHDVGLSGALGTAVPAGALSSGRRRALNVALAFVGDPRFLVLDEPTSGMDPFVRRSMWDVLKRSRPRRAICLSTHYMEEAEMLGDQVCIMSAGAMQCYGSPDWLKVRLGSGYTLSLSRASSSGNGRTPSESSTRLALEQLLERLPTEALRREAARGGLRVAGCTAAEAVLRLPFQAAQELPALLRYLDEQKHGLGFASLTVSATTLEELFVRLADGEAGAAPAPPQSSPPAPAGTAAVARGAPAPMAMGTAASMSALVAELARPSEAARGLAVRQAGALLQRRWLSVQRNKRSLLCMCLLPLAFNAIGLASIWSSFELDSPPLELLGTAADLNPKLGGAEPRAVLPFGAIGSSWQSARPYQLLQGGMRMGVWNKLDYLRADLPTNKSLWRAVTPRRWREAVQIEVLSESGGQGGVDGVVDLSKYREMREKGAPEFVIRKVMEKDGVPSGAVQQFFADPGLSPVPGTAQGDNGSVRVAVGLQDRAQISVDSARQEATLEFKFGQAPLRADVARAKLQREELAACASGGPGRAALAELATEKLGEDRRGMGISWFPQDMQSGGAPPFAQRAFLEQSGVSPEDVKTLIATISADSVPPEFRGQLERCARWQAFALALLNSSDKQAASRYGAFFIEATRPALRRARLAVFYNGSAPHSAPLFLGQLQRAIVASGARSAVAAREAARGVRVVNWPLPLTKWQREKAFSSQGFTFFTMSLIGAAFLPASVAADASRDVCGGIVRQQQVAGAPASVFVAAGCVADTLLVLPPLLTQLFFIKAFELAVFVDCLNVVAVLLALYSVASVLQAYALVPSFRTPSAAQNAALALNVGAGFIMGVICWILCIPFLGSTANRLGRAVELLGRLSPAFNLANAILTIPGTALPGFSSVHGLDPLDWRVTGEALAALAANIVAFGSVAVLRSWGGGPKFPTRTAAAVAAAGGRTPGAGGPVFLTEDPRAPPEVLEERQATERELQPGRAAADSAALVVSELSVSFLRGGGRACGSRCCGWRACEEQPALGPLSLVVPRGAVLGLLGVSGSGKSVALRCLAGALPAEAAVRGSARLCGRALLGRARRRQAGEAGWCPQDDNQLSPGLTVGEQIRLFGRLRGLRGPGLEEEARWLVRALDLGAYDEPRAWAPPDRDDDDDDDD